MKKVSKKFLCLVLAMVMLLCSLPSISINAQTTQNKAYAIEDSMDQTRRTGDLEIGNEFDNDVFVIESVEDYYKAANNVSDSKKDIASTSAQAVPKSVDNSTSKYFPKIGDQGSIGACVVFATVYYQFTYTMNKQRDVATTDDNIFSVKWNYNFVNSGRDVGSTAFENYNLIKQHGCPFEKSYPYDGKDYLGWCTDEKVWREAMRYRIEDYQMFTDVGKDDKIITSADDSDLIEIKTALANGDVLKFSSYIYDWDYDTIKTNPAAPENEKYVGEQFVRVVKGYDGGHGMAIVGYNDDLWCDINKNNKIDDGEMGAFKIANSWGEGYGNKGFMWIAYDAMNKVSVVSGVESYSDKPAGISEVYRIDVCDPKEGNDIYAKFTLNTANRADMSVRIFADKNGTDYSGYLLSSASYSSSANQYAFDGTTNAKDGTFIFPLDNLDPDISNEKFESYNFNVTVKDSAENSTPLVVKDISIVNEHTAKEYKVNSGLPVTLDGEERTFSVKESTKHNAVIYYIGYDNPNLHYKKSGESAFTKVKMEENSERRGALYKYVVEDVTGDVTLYFSDNSGKVDKNNGAYYTAQEGINNYYTKNQREKVKLSDFTLSYGIPDLGTHCVLDMDISGGYEPYQYSYYIENLTTGKIKECDYNYNYAVSPYVFIEEGVYRVTVTARDYAMETSTLTKEFEVVDHPFEITTVTLDKENAVVSKPVLFTSTTSFESIASWGGYSAKSRFYITDSSGKVWADEVVKYHSYSTKKRTTTTLYSFTPHKAGEYTLTVSSDDSGKQHAEKTIRFKVSDMMIGDADGSGSVTVMDATNVQRYLVNLIDETAIYLDLSDCDKSELVNVMDATFIQRYVAHADKTGYVGEVVEYIPPTEAPTEAPTQAPTQKETEAPKSNKVTFTNSFSWSGTIYCYYWSDSNTAMTSWPGVAMQNAGTNEYNEVMYTFDVPSGATYIIFTNGSAQTTDISYSGGEMRYYPISQTDSSGHNLVETW